MNNKEAAAVQSREDFKDAHRFFKIAHALAMGSVSDGSKALYIQRKLRFKNDPPAIKGLEIEGPCPTGNIDVFRQFVDQHL